jgi:hypothetical protein
VIVCQYGQRRIADLDRVQMHGNANGGFAVANGASAVVSGVGDVECARLPRWQQRVIELHHSVAYQFRHRNQCPDGRGIRLSDSTVTNNGTGLSMMGGTILSYGSNRIFGNAAGNGPPSSTVPCNEAAPGSVIDGDKWSEAGRPPFERRPTSIR